MSSFSLRDQLDISSAADLSVPLNSAVPRWQRKALQPSKGGEKTPGKPLVTSSKTPIVRRQAAAAGSLCALCLPAHPLSLTHTLSPPTPG